MTKGDEILVYGSGLGDRKARELAVHAWQYLEGCNIEVNDLQVLVEEAGSRLVN